MAEIECFLLQETETVRRTLRRFSWSGKGNDCPVEGHSYHNADTAIEDFQKPRTGLYEEAVPSDLISPDDLRWPKVCEACGYSFEAFDQRQINDHRLWENKERGILTTLREAPVGAMWLTEWMKDHGSRFWHERGGGPHLIVMTPAGEWDIDMPATNGDGWERTGEPPLVTASPSIGIGNPFRYHGWLREGKLVDA